MRPELTLEIDGVVDREADGLALRTALLDQFIDEQIGTPVTGDEVMYGERKTEILEDMYVETLVVDDQKNALVEMRALYTTAVTNDAGKLIESFDELAYVNELRRQLIDVQPMAERTLLNRASLVPLLTLKHPRLGFDVWTPNSGPLLFWNITR